MSIQSIYGLGEDDLTACLQAVFNLEGAEMDVSAALADGKGILEILAEALPGYTPADLTGCSIRQVLYMVDKEKPVIVRYGDNSALLITGYNSEQLVVAVPSESTVRFMSIERAESEVTAGSCEFFSYY